MHTFLHSMHVCTHICIHTFLQTFTHARVYTYVDLCMLTFLHTNTHTCLPIRTCMHTYIQINTYLYLQTIHTYTHTHTYIYTHTLLFRSNLQILNKVYSSFQFPIRRVNSSSRENFIKAQIDQQSNSFLPLGPVHFFFKSEELFFDHDVLGVSQFDCDVLSSMFMRDCTSVVKGLHFLHFFALVHFFFWQSSLLNQLWSVIFGKCWSQSKWRVDVSLRLLSTQCLDCVILAACTNIL